MQEPKWDDTRYLKADTVQLYTDKFQDINAMDDFLGIYINFQIGSQRD